MTRWGVAALIWATLTTASAQAPGASGSPPVQARQFTLANGMSLIIKPDRRAPTAVHMLWLRVGSMDEVDGSSGVAHVLEHMLFKGTPAVPVGEFSRRVAALGGRDNAFTSQDYTGYYQQIPSAKLEDVMQLEADRFAHNQWADEEFNKELEVVKEERRMRTEDNPRALLYEALNATVFVASPYRRPIVGWPSRAVPERKPRVEPAQTGLKRIAFKAPAEQAMVTLAFKVPSFQSFEGGQDETDALALTVLAAVLDGYSGARLERALTQGPNRVADSAGADNGLWGRGPQLFTLSGVPAQGKTAEQVEAALREQVTRVAMEGVSEAELTRVKTQWVASAVYKLDSVFNQARELGTSWVQGQPLDANERLIERLRTVTADQVRVVAGKYFGDDQLTVARLMPQPLSKERKPRTASASARH